MLTYTNEQKIKDIPLEYLEQSVILPLMQQAYLDFDSKMEKDVFIHSYKSLAKKIHDQFKMFDLGNIRHVFEVMLVNIKGPLSVYNIMGQFYNFKHIREQELRDFINEHEATFHKDAINCGVSPMGSAIIWKIEEYYRQKSNGHIMTDEEWSNLSLKDIARDLATGRKHISFKPTVRNANRRINE